MAVLATVQASCGGRAPAEEAQTRAADFRFQNAPVIVISIDTLRSDHLPAYGYRGVETPNIDALRRDSVLFERAYSHSPLTLPSHVSVFTGVLPATHGVRNNLGFTFDGTRHASIQRLLGDSGYATGAAVSAYVLRSGTGLGAVFDDYDEAFLLQGEGTDAALERSGRDTVEAAKVWIGQHLEQPFFYFLHLFEPHTPYRPPEPFKSRFELAYDGEIATADAALGEFLDFLEEVGIYRRAIIVFLSDHGEGLGDHGEEEHGIFLYREAIQVPLIVKLPGGALGGSTVEGPVQLVDLLPTIAGLVGVAPPVDLPGYSLFRRGNGDAESREIVAETWVPRIHFGWSELWSLVDGRYHLIQAPRPELYDLIEDPEERHNLFRTRSDVVKRLVAALEPRIVGLDGRLRIDPAVAERLHALGYVGHLAGRQTGDLPDPKDRIGAIRLINQADRLAAAGKADEAVRRLRLVLDENPGLTAGWLHLARALQQDGRLQEAIPAYERTIKLDPSLTAKCGGALTSIYLKLRRYDEAEAWACRTIDAGSATGHLQLGRIRFAKGDLKTAEIEARSAMEDRLNRVAGAVLLAEVFAVQGRVDEALRVVDEAHDELRASDLAPVPRLHMVRGDLYGRLERFDEAEREFLAEISSFPDNLVAYTNLAVVYYVIHRPDQARAILEQMVQANPNSISPVMAARTCRQVGDTAAAESWQRRIEARL